MSYARKLSFLRENLIFENFGFNFFLNLFVAYSFTINSKLIFGIPRERGDHTKYTKGAITQNG